MTKILVVGSGDVLSKLRKIDLEEMVVCLEKSSGISFPRAFELVAHDVPSLVHSTYQKKSKGEKKRQRSQWNRNMK